jgi:PIN domain-containing protein
MKNVFHHHIHRAKVGLKPEHGRTSLFVHNTEDDEWIEFVGSREWVVISQDYSLHLEDAVVSAIKQYKVKVFYLWGANEKKHETMRVFLNNHDRIVDMATRNPGPYIFRVKKRGPLQRFM